MDDFAEIGDANHFGYERSQEESRTQRDIIPAGECVYFDEAYERLVFAEIFLADFLQDPVAGKIIIQGPGIMEKHDAQRSQWILYLSYDILALDIQGCVGP